MVTFGEFFKQKRMELGVTLRQFCLEHNLDPGNVSRIERGKMAPPIDRIDEFAGYLKIDDAELQAFKDLASISAGRIPEDLRDKETLARLPVFFRTLRGKGFSEEELKALAKKIEES